MSGVHQPSISQFLSGRIEMSDDLLERLLNCLGFRLEVVRRFDPVSLDRSHRRSWLLHRELATRLTPARLNEWAPTIDGNLGRLRRGIRGEPHLSNIDRWEQMVATADLSGLRRAMTGLDIDSIQMREVSPLGGLLPQAERSAVLAGARP